MSARRKVAKGVRCSLGAKPCLFLVFGMDGGTAGDDLREMPSTLTKGLEVPEMFQRKMFHGSRIFLISFDGTYPSPASASESDMFRCDSA